MMIFLSIIRGAPIGHFKNLDRKDWIRANNENMLTSIEMIKTVIDSIVIKNLDEL